MNGLMAKSLRDQRRAAIGWGIGLAVVALMYAAFYPSIRDSAAALRDYVRNLPEALKSLIGGGDYTSPAGYLRTEFFSTMGPILFLVFAIGAGSRALAGEEEARTLDLLLSTPVRRAQLVRDKAAAIVAAAAMLAAVSFLAVAIFGPLFGLRVGAFDVAAACLMLALLGLTFGSVAFAIGAATGHRVFGNAVAGALAVVAFIVNALGPSVSWLEPLRPASPMRWYMDPDPLTTGLHPANVAILGGVIILMYVAAHVAFARRDLAA